MSTVNVYRHIALEDGYGYRLLTGRVEVNAENHGIVAVAVISPMVG
jgi:hypothetical protein